MRECLAGLLIVGHFLDRTDAEVLLQIFWDIPQQHCGTAGMCGGTSLSPG
jgi:hypothetical protein